MAVDGFAGSGQPFEPAVDPETAPRFLPRFAPIFPRPLAAAGGEATVAPGRTHFEYLGLW